MQVRMSSIHSPQKASERENRRVMTTDGGRHQMLLGLTIMHYSFRNAAKI